MNSPPIAIVMGSKSDWPTMSAASDVLDQFNVDFHVEVVSAHRTPTGRTGRKQSVKRYGQSFIHCSNAKRRCRWNVGYW